MLAKPNLVVVLAALAAGCGGAAPGELTSSAAEARTPSACRQPMPVQDLELPAGQELELEAEAVGTQNYTCSLGANGAPAWVFTAPEATLYRRGRVVATHFAGPTWKANDGSTVVASRIAGFSPDPSAIPWLRLGATSHTGHGRFSEVSQIQRVATQGGLAPAASGCTVGTLGAVAKVPYTATYCFAEAED